MQQIPAEVILIHRVYALFWVFAVGTILIAGQWWTHARDFRDTMLRQWKASLVIALLYAFGAGMGGMGFFSGGPMRIFCEAMIGLALAYSITDFELLPVTQSVLRREQLTENIRLMLAAALGVVMVAFIVSGLLWSVLLQIFGETTSDP